MPICSLFPKMIFLIYTFVFLSMIELLRSIYLQQVKLDETQSAASMCQSIVQQLGNTV